jgi:hypothetical protein
MAKGLPCPQTVEGWKELVAGLGGEARASLAYFRNKGMPDLATAKTILGGFEGVGGEKSNAPAAPTANAPEPQAGAGEPRRTPAATPEPSAKPPRSGFFADAPDDVLADLDYLKKIAKSNKGAVGPGAGDFDPVRTAKAVQNVGKHILNEGVKTAEEWKDAVVKAVGEHVRPYLDEAWAALNPEAKTGGEGGHTTSIMNRVVKPEAEEYGLDPVEREAKKTRTIAHAQAQTLLEADPAHGRDLVASLIAKKRQVTDVEANVIGLDRMRIQNEIRAAQTKGEDTGPLIKQLQDNQQARAIGAQNNAAGLKAFDEFIKEDYSLGTGLMNLHAKLGREPNAEESARVQDLSDKLAAQDKKIAELEAQAKKPAKVTEKPTAATRFVRNKVFTQSKVDAARAYFSQTSPGGRLTAGIDPEALMHATNLGGAYIEAGVRSFADWSENMLKECGEAIRPHLDAIYQKVSNDKRVATAIKTTTTQAGKYANATGKGEPLPKPPPIIPNKELMDARFLRDAYREEYNAFTKPQPPPTAWDAARDMFRATILSGPGVIEKIGMATVTNPISEALTKPAEFVAGRVRVGGQRMMDISTSKGNPRVSDVVTNVRAMISHATWHDLVNMWHTGSTDITRAANLKPRNIDVGGSATVQGVTGRILNTILKVHGLMKTPVERATFEESLRARTRNAIGRGLDVRDPVVQLDITTGAAYDAIGQAFLGENVVADLINEAKASATRKSPALGFLVHTIAPIAKVSTNFVGRSIENAGLGLPEAAVRYGKMWNDARTGKEITDVQATKFINAVRQGSLGVPVALVGMGLVKGVVVAGYGQHRPKGQNGQMLPPGSIEINGHLLTHKLLHSPPIEAISTWATFHNELSAGKHAPIAAGKAVGHLVKEGPALYTISDMTQALTTGDFGGMAGAYVRGFIPQAIQQVAAGTDVDKQNPTVKDYAKGMFDAEDTVQRKPKGFTEQVKMGIPGKYGRGSVPMDPAPIKAAFAARAKSAKPEQLDALAQWGFNNGLFATMKGAAEAIKDIRMPERVKAAAKARKDALKADVAKRRAAAGIGN